MLLYQSMISSAARIAAVDLFALSFDSPSVTDGEEEERTPKEGEDKESM